MFITQIEGQKVPQSEGLLEILLPQELLDRADEKSVQQGLESIRKILSIVQSAFRDLLGDKDGRHLGHLDGLVKDCACQVRAIENLVFEKKLQVDPAVAERIRLGLENLEKHYSSLLQASQDKKGERKTVRSLLTEKQDLFSILSDIDVKILVLSEMLFQVKRETVPQGGSTPCPGCGAPFLATHEVTVTKVFSDIFVSTKRCRQVVNLAQARLAEISCTRLIELVQEKDLPIGRQLTEGAVKTVEGSGEKRKELPAALTLEAALQLAAAHKIAVLVKSKLTEHCIEQSSEEGRFDVHIPCIATIDQGDARLLPTTPEVLNKAPFLVVAGIRAKCSAPFEPQMLYKADLAKVLQENGANHFQYTDGRDSGAEELDFLRSRELGDFADLLVSRNSEGKESGCVQENARLFVTTHIFPSSLEEEQPIVPREAP